MAATVKIVSAVEAVSGALSEDIFRMAFAPGQQVTEGELVARYGVSRNTVREAIAGLLASGLLVKEINKGVYVRRINEEDVRELFHLRALLETEAARIVSRSGVIPLGLVRAMERIEEKADLADKDWYRFVEVDLDFHIALVDAANSPRLNRLYSAIGSEIMLCLCQSKDSLTPNPKNLYEHRLFIEVLESGDEEKAVALVRNHISYGIESVARGFQKPLP